MGRTVATYRTVLEALISDWQGFRKALRKEDQEAFDRLMEKAPLIETFKSHYLMK
jgi:hypothetical protein